MEQCLRYDLSQCVALLRVAFQKGCEVCEMWVSGVNKSLDYHSITLPNPNGRKGLFAWDLSAKKSPSMAVSK